MSKSKLYNLGVICGRFGHEHLGHIILFDNCISLCKKTLILVGSAQESKTLRNPFKVETRIKLIKKTYPNIPEENLIIKGINDLTNEFDVTHNWGKYVKSEVERHMGQFADLIVYGNDELRNHWFEQKDLENTSLLVIPRTAFPISATVLRGLLTIDDKQTWMKYTSPLIHDMYDELRNELMLVPIYKSIYDKISKTEISLENFMFEYKILETKDKERKMKICKN